MDNINELKNVIGETLHLNKAKNTCLSQMFLSSNLEQVMCYS